MSNGQLSASSLPPAIRASAPTPAIVRAPPPGARSPRAGPRARPPPPPGAHRARPPPPGRGAPARRGLRGRGERLRRGAGSPARESPQRNPRPAAGRPQRGSARSPRGGLPSPRGRVLSPSPRALLPGARCLDPLVCGRRARLGLAHPAANRAQLVEEVVEAILDRLEPVRERTETLLEPLHVARGGDVQSAHRGALGLCGALPRPDRPGHRLVEQRVVEEGLRQVAQRLLAARPNPTAGGFLAQASTSSGFVRRLDALAGAA